MWSSISVSKHIKKAILVAVLTAIGSVHAAVLEEVVVTAQKREQSLQDVGIAVNAFTGDQMRSLGVKDSFDLATFTPGIHISGNLAGQNTQFSIRGVTQNDFVDVIEAPNAVYLDEGYIAVAQAQTFALFDLERVEALKGPQGTLFGRNATGGLIHFISRKPSLEETDGYLDVTAGYFDTEADATQIKTEGAFGGPITEDIAARVAFMTNNQDGYLNNNYPFKAVGAASFGSPNGGLGNSPGPGAGADMGDDDTWAVRGSVLLAPTENTDFLLSVNKARSNLATGPYQSKSTIGIFNSDPIAGTGQLINTIDTPATETRESIIQGTTLDGGSDRADSGVFTQVIERSNFVDNFPIPTPAPGADFYGYIDPDGGDWTTFGDFAFEDNGFTNSFGGNLNIKHSLNNNLTFTSITDYKDYSKLLFIDVDSAPHNDLANYAGLDADSITQEFRLNAENDDNRWVLGLYYLHID
ncbi:MAG: TonB-dependent receptor, partial [Gammaproteobacteria bacterium]|nr:TonB-dependent receptor [Gammaproteobacteria bacterium]